MRIIQNFYRKFSTLSIPLISCGCLLFSVASFSASKRPGDEGRGSRRGGRTVGDILQEASERTSASVRSRSQQKSRTQLPSTSGFFLNSAPGSFAGSRTTDLSSIRPTRTASTVYGGNDGDPDRVEMGQLEHILDQQIRELFSLVQKYRNSPQRGELWLRLAELYVEKASIVGDRIRGDYDKKLQSQRSGSRSPKPRMDLSESHSYSRKAIQLYEWYVRDFPKDPKMDQALYFLGYNYYEINQVQKGTYYYSLLSQKFPHSDYVMETNFALGEYYFEAEKWGEASSYYQKLFPHTRHRLYGHSLYKYSWCLFRMSRYPDALRFMERVIKLSRAAAATNDSRKMRGLNLEAEGLRDIVLFYSEVGSADNASDYFQAFMEPKMAEQSLEKLAYLYLDRGRRDDGRKLFNILIHNHPTSPKAYVYKYQIIKAYSNATSTQDFKEELFSWIQDFKEESPWYEANSRDKKLMEESYRLREASMRGWTLQQLQTAQNSRGKFSQSLARQGCEIYLREFPKTSTYGDMLFYYAELLYDMKEYDSAAIEYKRVVEKFPSSRYAQLAAKNFILAMEKVAPQDQAIASKVGASLEPIPLDPKMEKFIEAMEWYIKGFPKDEKVAEFKFRVGRLRYQYNHFDQAIIQFRDVIKSHPRTKYAEYSANLLLDIYNLRKDYAGLEKTGLELMTVPGLESTSAGKDIRDVMESTSFKKAQDLELAKDYRKSAEQFDQFAKIYPHSSLRSKSLFNAAVNYERAGLMVLAMGAHEEVLKTTDKETQPLRQKSRQVMGKFLQDAGRLEEAARVFYQVGLETDRRDPLAVNFFLHSAVLHEALEGNDQAIQSYEMVLQRTKNAKERGDALFRLAELYRKDQNRSKAIDKYKEYFHSGLGREDKLLESTYWLQELYFQQGKTSESAYWKQKFMGLFRGASADQRTLAQSFAAKIQFRECETLYREFRNIDLPSNPQQQDATLKKKIGLLNRLNTDLLAVTKLNSPDEIVGALSLSGLANWHLGEFFTGAPLPGDLKTEEEKKQYIDGVRKVAEPFFAKGKESLQKAVEKGIEFDSYGDYYMKARDLVAKMDGEHYYEGSEAVLETREFHWMGLDR